MSRAAGAIGGVDQIGVIGVGCVSALGRGLEESLGALFSATPEPRPPTRFSTGHAAPLPVFEAEVDYVEPPSGELMRTAHLALDAAGQALEDTGVDDASLGSLRVATVVGTTVGATLNNEEFYRRYLRGTAAEEEGRAALARMARSNPAEAIAQRFGFSGPLQTVSNACSSGTDAIGLGASWIRAGLADLVLAGGADELCRYTLCGFSSLMVTSAEPCKPFDRTRSGLNLGEGAAFLVLASERAIERLGVAPRARVCGFGASCDAHHLTAPHPEGTGLKSAIKMALDEWGGNPGDLALVNAHGTATRDNDQVEGRALTSILPEVPFHSTKGYTGHTLGAAGALEAALTIGFLERGRAPGSMGFGEPDPEIGIAPFVGELELKGRYALSQSLAFGGSNAAVVLGVER